MQAKDIKKELVSLTILFVALVIIGKIVFYQEAIFVIARFIAAFYWLLILPGFFLMYYWKERLGFLERLLLGVALGASILGISSYYLGLLGLHIKYHYMVIPSVMLIIGLAIVLRGGSKEK
jgi:uncharacterized membrane protein